MTHASANDIAKNTTPTAKGEHDGLKQLVMSADTSYVKLQCPTCMTFKIICLQEMQVLLYFSQKNI